MTHCSYLFSLLSSSLDACSGGPNKTPDATVYAVLDAQNFDQQELYYRAIRHYVEVCYVCEVMLLFLLPSWSILTVTLLSTQQCTLNDDPFQFIRDYQAEIVSTARACHCLSRYIHKSFSLTAHHSYHRTRHRQQLPTYPHH